MPYDHRHRFVRPEEMDLSPLRVHLMHHHPDFPWRATEILDADALGELHQRAHLEAFRAEIMAITRGSSPDLNSEAEMNGFLGDLAEVVTNLYAERREARRARFHLDLIDLANMPGFNPETQRGRGEWSLRDVSAGAVRPHPVTTAVCVEHGAMNAVNEQATIWRCLACGRAAYRPRLSDLMGASPSAIAGELEDLIRRGLVGYPSAIEDCQAYEEVQAVMREGLQP